MSKVALTDWIGKQEFANDVISLAPLKALSATLDLEHIELEERSKIRGLWHWLYFLPMHPQKEIGKDGHARRGGFLPPVELPRRMWAGGQFIFHSDISIGDKVKRISTIENINEKSGRTGPLVFVKIRHEIYIQNKISPSLIEYQDIVYRDKKRESEKDLVPKRADVNSEWFREVAPDEVLLFRYSALTFNGHRIHYDRRYATEEEGYPGLVVHGPLLATLLMDLVYRQLPHVDVKEFRFKALRPIFDLNSFSLHGEPSDSLNNIKLWIKDHDGLLAMEAETII
jgi:3-methylfumaryl-CoA hydratase